MKPNRTQRLDSEYRRAVSEVISGTLKNREPELKGIVSVTEANVAPDLKTAKIYVSILAASEEERERSFAIIRENAGLIRRELSKVMTMRTVPALTFFKDGSMEYGSHIDELLANLKKEEK